jgi:hypothetical protein
MRKLTVDVPDELVELAGGSETQATSLMTQAAIAELVRRRVISSGKASELLGIDQWELPNWLSKFEVAVADFDPATDLEPFR